MWLFNRKNRLIPLLLIAFGEIAWGINVVVNKIGVESIPVFTFASVKFAIAALILWPLARKHWKKMSVRDFLLITVSGWIGLGLNVILYYKGLQMTSGLTASMIMALSPLLIFFLSVKTLNEKFEPRALVGSLIALAGVMIIIFDPTAEVTSGNEWLGGLLVLLASLAAAIGTITKKPILKKYHTYQIVFMTMIMSLIPLSALATQDFRQLDIATLPLEAWVSVLYGSVIALGLGFVAYFKGLSNLSMERASVFDYLLPVTGVTTAILLLHERPDEFFIVGTVIVIAGITISQVKISHLLYLHKNHH